MTNIIPAIVSIVDWSWSSADKFCASMWLKSDLSCALLRLSAVNVSLTCAFLRISVSKTRLSSGSL